MNLQCHKVSINKNADVYCIPL